MSSMGFVSVESFKSKSVRAAQAATSVTTSSSTGGSSSDTAAMFHVTSPATITVDAEETSAAIVPPGPALVAAASPHPFPRNINIPLAQHWLPADVSNNPLDGASALCRQLEKKVAYGCV